MFKKESFDDCEGCAAAVKVPCIEECCECCEYEMSSSPCPCKSCLLKAMCSDACDKFDELYKSLHRLFNERIIRSYEWKL